ncbi:MAG: helix-turn-helix domain-containing protein [Luteitalea sp.]|nr:helix-turn-helix domain-containing protein [Luteitalea sp.]
MGVLMDTRGADVFADVLDSLKLRGRVFCRCELSAPWALGFAAGDFSHFHVIEQGRCWLRLEGRADAIAIEEGDLLLVPRGHGYQLSDHPHTAPIPLTDLIADSEGGLRAVLRYGGGGRETRLICGSFEFAGPHVQSFLAVLPEWIRVPKDDCHGNEWLDATIRLLRRETQQTEVGAETIIARLIDVMFVEAVRTWLREQPSGSAGWLGALRDPGIGVVLGLIHQSPERRWTVPALAAAIGMSRSPFAAKFTALVGVSPMAYLKRWRMHVGAALLRQHTLAVSSIAERAGYESVEAFSRVFTREFGVPPGTYRRRAQRLKGQV